ncbi:hypothetical protein [Campylobacter mucosalis]|uniref:hypothetical protein n=1 Tax=Campylobacter mucosalis TaxID=202 RepID=UPI0014707425|nr:hypothetical protein [Campylobacter mucosalis]
MALWQIFFYILPDIGDTYASFNKEVDFDDSAFWKKINIKKDFFIVFKNILALNKSWSSSIDLYGHQQSNCIEVMSDDFGNVESVSFRIDFTSEYDKILDYIIKFCKNNSFCILDSKLNKIKLDRKEFVKYIIKTPNAKKYKELIK